MIGLLISKISKSRALVKILRALIARVPLFAVVTKALLLKSYPQNRWPLNSREEEIFKLLSHAHEEIRP